MKRRRRRASATEPSRASTRCSDRRAATLRALIGPAPGVVVDVRAGGGPGAADLLPQGRATVVVRADRPPPMSGPGPGPVVVADPARLPLRDGCADLVTCVDGLGRLPTHRRVVREVARASAGRCIVVVPWDPWHRMGNLLRGRHLRRLGRPPGQVESFTPKRLMRALRRGFRDVELRPDLPWLVAAGRGPRR